MEQLRDGARKPQLQQQPTSKRQSLILEQLGGQQEHEGWSEQVPPRRPQLRAPETLELELELRQGQRRVRTRALQALQPMHTAWGSQWRQLHGEMRVS